jgi:hypothetical protein
MTGEPLQKARAFETQYGPRWLYGPPVFAGL